MRKRLLLDGNTVYNYAYMNEGDHQAPNPANDQPGWQYKGGGASASNPQPFVEGKTDSPSPSPATKDDIEWTASEFMAHDKSASWYTSLVIGAIVVAAFMYFVLHDILSIVVVIVLATVVGMAGAHKPKTLTYRLNDAGLLAGSKFHGYGEYKSFILKEEGAFASIELLPLKRFDFPLNVYLAPESEAQVVELISEHLPLERDQPDGIERITRSLRF